MIDSFELLREKIEHAPTRQELGVCDQPYAVVTLHRPSNVDRPEKLAALVNGLAELAVKMPVVFAIHPRTRKRLRDFGLEARIFDHARVRAIEPLGYIEFMSLVLNCTIAITDSGGIQEETTYLGIPCATLRDNTERPITVTEGTNRLLKPNEILSAAEEAMSGRWPKGRRPQHWDGHTAHRAATSLRRLLSEHDALGS
jgi:UDP-N-acetylglucosamine 2-epimerase (non-hydrolysing)